MTARLQIGVAAVAASLLCAAPALAAEGDLDTTFGTGGRVVTTVGSTPSENAITMDAQGRIIVGGSVDLGPGNGIDMVLARYLPNGALDPSFSGDGIATFDSPVAADDEESIFALTVDPQGGILGAGYTNRPSGLDYALIRVNPDGTLDTGFGPPGSGGFVRQNMFGTFEIANGIALDSQGRIVVSGTSQFGDFDFAVARFTPSGILDTSFGGGGIKDVDFTPFGGDQDQASAVVVDAADRIVIAGNTNRTAMGGNPAVNGFGLARLNSDGTNDTSFGPDHTGFVTTKFTDSGAGALALTLAPDGKLVAVGSATLGDATVHFALARYNDDGSIDQTFGFGGTRIPPRVAGDTARYEAHGVALDSQGRLIVAGWAKTSNGDTYDIVVRRYLTNGDPDPYGGGEARVTNGGQTAGLVLDAADRAIVAAKVFGPTFAENQFGLARFIGDAVAPPAPSVGAGPADGSLINDATPTFEFSSGEAGATFACGFDGASSTCASPFTPGTPLADGQHTFNVSAVDLAGNASTPATRTFTVDTKAPEITIKGDKKLETDAEKAREKLKIKTSEAAELTCKVDKKKAKPCHAKFKTKLKLGKHKIKVEATDRAGNSSDEAKKIKVVSKP